MQGLAPAAPYTHSRGDPSAPLRSRSSLAPFYPAEVVTASVDFDVIVIGAGHAGCEAAWAAARMGCRVGLVTLSAETVALMPCNPAIGGTAKGHLVREIDALGGLMGRAIDDTGLQFKLLNRSRGPAVWSPRAQADKKVYGRWVKHALDAEPNITWLFGKVGRVLTSGGRVVGVAMEEGDAIRCSALVVTTGTFLNGLIHIGPEQHPAGRAGEPPSRELANLDQLGFGTAAVATFPRNRSPIGCCGMIGDVWEWTSSDFGAWPGFAAFPYQEYSEVFFGNEYKVLRGGSWATRPGAMRNTFRNWDYPIRRQIFSGFRCARDA